MAGPAEVPDLASDRAQREFRQQFPKSLEIGLFFELNRLGDTSIVDGQV